MDYIITFFSNLHNLNALITWGGYTVLAIIVFAESGLLFGFFLPGDSLLVTAGLLATQGYLNIWELFFLLATMAIVGDSVGYQFGKYVGPKLFKREKSILFAKDHLLKAKAFYDKHGGKTIILARFMPIVRTFAPIVAGAGSMPYKRFLLFNVIGGIAWTGSMLGIGYFLGKVIPGVDRYLHIVIGVVILLSISPGIYAWIREKMVNKNNNKSDFK
ncbi:MAG: VTT domain-containing protein [Patescibacteria group bacterium]|nr:VTT domain-containing protein [Patescibacteria group bacterium]